MLFCKMCCASLENIDLFTKLHGVTSQRTVIFTVIILGTYIGAVSYHHKGGQYLSLQLKIVPSNPPGGGNQMGEKHSTGILTCCVYVHRVFLRPSTTISYKNIIYICIFIHLLTQQFLIKILSNCIFL
jgi:hypothetical protein